MQARWLHREEETPRRRKQPGTRRRRLTSSNMTNTSSEVPHLFDCWEQISKKISATKGIRLFLDFDGTLVPYCDAPEDVKLSAACRMVLARLVRHRRVHVAIVSGRRNVVLRKYIRVRGIQYLGLFGWEKTGGPALPRPTQKALRDLGSVLAPLPVTFPGVRVENKGASYAVHFRGVSPDVQRRVQSRTRNLLARIRPNFRMIQSNHACEIVPLHVLGKGVAMREFTRALQAPFLPIYAGDDLTDEPAFLALRGGITVRVGPFSRTHAKFRLRDPEEVFKFLEWLEEELS
jgi:trehalose-phosphatase